jgi:hypothetical protein
MRARWQAAIRVGPSPCQGPLKPVIIPARSCTTGLLFQELFEGGEHDVPILHGMVSRRVGRIVVLRQ